MFVCAIESGVLSYIYCFAPVVRKIFMQVRRLDVDVFDVHAVLCCDLKYCVYCCLVSHVRCCFGWIKVLVR